jgi:hypothetical protein
MREVKAEIAAELQAVEDRRCRLLALLAENPGQRYAVIYDPGASADYDVLAMAIPEATFEVRIPKPEDSLAFSCALMQMLDRHGEAKA